jgi:hypothetical protein
MSEIVEKLDAEAAKEYPYTVEEITFMYRCQEQLLSSYTAFGAAMWWHREKKVLDNRTPYECMRLKLWLPVWRALPSLDMGAT